MQEPQNPTPMGTTPINPEMPITPPDQPIINEHIETPPVILDQKEEALKPKSSNKGLCSIILLFFIGLGFIGLALGGGFLYGQLKSQYIPYLSPALEDIVNTPSEQLGLRIDAYSNVIETISKNGETEGSDPMMEFFSNLNSLDSEAGLKINYTLIQEADSVLGLDINPGEVDDQDLMDIMNASEGELNAFFSSTYNLGQEGDMESKGTTQLQLKAGGKEIGMEMESVQFVNEQDSVSYLKLTKFPKNDYLNTDQFLNKWVRISAQELLGYSITDYLEGQSSEELEITNEQNDLTSETFNTLAEELPKIRTIITSEAFSKAITISEPLNVNGESLKCYNLHIDSTNAESLVSEINKIYPTNESQSQNYSDIPTIDIRICFDSLLMVKRVEMDMNAPSTSGLGNADLDVSGYIQINSFNQAYDISAPSSEVMEFSEIDWMEVMPMMYYTYEPEYDMDYEIEDLDFDINSIEEYEY